MSTLNKLKVAITGNIGAGKSTFASFLKESGYPIILADEISKEFLSNDPEVRSEVIKEFGEKSFVDNKVNKKYLADSVFTDRKKLQKLNAILHPRVRIKIDSLSEEYFKSNNIVFVEAALIYESKMERMYDYIVLITSERDERFTRSAKSRKITRDEFDNRDKNQIDEKVKKQKADFIFSNDGTIEDLKKKSILLLGILNSILKSN